MQINDNVKSIIQQVIGAIQEQIGVATQPRRQPMTDREIAAELRRFGGDAKAAGDTGGASSDILRAAGNRLLELAGELEARR